jgi:hypothetical protein
LSIDFRVCTSKDIQIEKHLDQKTKAGRSRRLFPAWHRRDEMSEEGFHLSMINHRDRFLDRRPKEPKEF